MGRTHFAAVILISFFMIGCFGNPIAKWGEDDGEFRTSWDKNTESQFTVNSNIYENEVGMNLTLQGCDESGAELIPGTTGEITQEVKVSGWLISSKFWTATDNIKENDQQVIPASVLVGLDEFNTAKSNSFDSYDKISVEWSMPTIADTMPKLDASTNDHSNYGVLGLIPSNNRILNGFEALSSFHQPIELTGYAVNTLNPTEGAYQGSWTIGEDCRASKLAETGITMVVTGINLDDSQILMGGDEKSKWTKGDVSILPGGYYTYMLLVLIGGGGGAFLLFTFSIGIERHGAKSAAKAMLTDAQMKMAKVVKKDIKRAKKDGVDLSAGSMISNEDKIVEKKKTTQKLDDFDVESVLSSISEGRAQGAELGGGGVVLTDDAYDMGDQLQDSIDSAGINLGDSTERIGHTLAFDIDDILNPQEENNVIDHNFTPPSNTEKTRPVTTNRRKIRGSQSMSEYDNDEREERPPRKRKVVRKTKSIQDSEERPRKGPPSTKTENMRKPTIEDEDFSDFSF